MITAIFLMVGFHFGCELYRLWLFFDYKKKSAEREKEMKKMSEDFLDVLQSIKNKEQNENQQTKH